MNYLALVIALLTIVFLVFQIKGFICDLKKRREARKQSGDKSNIKGDKVDDRN